MTAGQDPVVISEAARNLGADNGILTGTFFQAGDIRRRLTLRPAKGGMESEWLECGFQSRMKIMQMLFPVRAALGF